MGSEIEILGPKDLPHVEELEKEIAALKADNDALYKALHSLDQKLWLMSQCEDFDAMRPHFLQALEQVNSRKSAENKRITELLVPELKKVYK